MKNLLLLLILVLSACKSPDKHSTRKSHSLAWNNTNNYVVISNKFGPYTAPSAPLSTQEIHTIDSLIKKAIVEHNKTADKHQLLDSPMNYHKQLWASIDNDHRKVVSVNCFCDTSAFPNWRKEKIAIVDGGNCFFELEINLKTKSVDYLIVKNTAGTIYIK